MIRQLTEAEVLTNVLEKTSELVEQWLKYERRWQTFITWETLRKWEGGDIRVRTNYFYRFCKTYASYIIKDAPNIQVPAERADQIESKILASKKERALYYRWQGNSFIRKLKRAALRWLVFGDMYFMQSFNKDKKRLELDVIDPSFIVYDTEDNDPTSPILRFLKAKVVDVELLKQKYPKHANMICSSDEVDKLINIKDFTKTTLWSGKKAVVYTYFDQEYMYEVINGKIVLDSKKHWYDKIPIYHRPVIDTWDKYGDSLIEILYEPVKAMHLALSFLLTNAYDTAKPPLVSTGANVQFDSKMWPKGLINIPAWSMLNYLQPPQSSADLYKTLEFAKLIMHFISGISEEAMAWFTWSLTASWVSIELRLDSTVREAIDAQIILKDILEKINADWLRWMKKFMAKTNLFKMPTMWEVSELLPFTWDMIWNSYYNIVDFGGILPRSDSTIINNVLAKKKMGLISHDTALEELRYQDPSMEISKIKKEQIDMQKLWQALQQGKESELTGFQWPKDENYYMLSEWRPAPVHPNQNHTEHWMEHKKIFDKTKNPIVLVHMQWHEQLMRQWSVWVSSEEQTQDMVKRQFAEPSSQQEMGMQQQPPSEEGVMGPPNEWGVPL